MSVISRLLSNTIGLAVVAVVVLVTGAAAITGSIDSSPSLDSSTQLPSTIEVGGQAVIPVEDAGTITISRDATTLTIVAAAANPGWQAVVEVAQGREVEASLRSGTDRHDVNIELEDGVVRVRIRSRLGSAEQTSTSVIQGGGDTTSSTSVAAGGSTSTSVPGSTSTSSTLPGGSTTSSTSSTSTSTTVPTSLPSSDAQARSVDVLDAGTAQYVVEGNQILLVDVEANAGWTVIVERASGREVEASWRGNGRVDLNLELEDGQVRIRIRDRRTDTRTETRVPAGATSSTSSTTSTTVPTTIPSSSSSTSTTSTVPEPTTTSAPTTETIHTAGGSVTVTINGNTLTLASAVPSAGYEVDVRKSGGDEVDVRFENDDRESRVELKVNNGVLRRDIEER